MTSIQKTFQFKYTWRSYQRRFLEGFDTHFEDNHLHVVAPPGSGKTVLGLEMIRRVNQKNTDPCAYTHHTESVARTNV